MSVWPALILFGLVLGCGWILSRCFGVPSAAGRFVTIDGLRGYLAFGVFVHHGAVWYCFLRSGIWDMPPSCFYLNLGQASVLLFFMITGFLFWTKLLRAGSEPLDWSRLYLSRILRLVPLYLVAVTLMAGTVAIITGFQIRESIAALIKNLLEWGTFSVTGIPDINRLHNTAMIIGKVTWTLPYEWLFYCALPLLALLLRVPAPRRFIMFALAAVATIAWQIQPEPIYLAAFCGGIAAACLVHFNLIQDLSRKSVGSIAATVSLCVALGLFPNAKNIFAVLVLTIAFAIIAGGNTLFGILTWNVSRFLGELTYSIYLLHSLVLFWMFRFVIGGHNAIQYSAAQHWLAIALCIPVVLIFSSITFRFIELPAMKSLGRVSGLLQGLRKERAPMQPSAALSAVRLEPPPTVAPTPT